MRRHLTALAVVFASLLLFSAAAFAGSDPNGYYQGLPIVHLDVNGQTLVTDVPAVILNGRTMVPISYVASAAGGTSGWDQTTMTASITMPEPTTNAALHTQLLNLGDNLVASANASLVLLQAWNAGTAVPTSADQTTINASLAQIHAYQLDVSDTYTQQTALQTSAKLLWSDYADALYQTVLWVSLADQAYLAGNTSYYSDDLAAEAAADSYASTVLTTLNQDLGQLQSASTP